jgi:basic membrane protein A and related proteins
MKKTNLLMSLAATGALLAACGGSAPGAPAAPAATTAPAAGKQFKVGLVTDVGSLDDKSFNASAWAGVQRAAKEFNVEVKAIESKQPTDYQKNIEQFLTEGYDMVITVGFLMGDDTAKAANANPNAKLAIVDVGYFDDKAPKNVMGLLFAEDESGFVAGAIAGWMSKSGTVGGVYGINIPPVCKFRVGYELGAKYANPNIKALGVYQEPGPKAFNDPEWGGKTAKSQIDEGADVIFSAGGNTGNGGLLKIAEEAKAGKNVLGIGVDQDQYNTLEGARPILLTSAMKKVDVATYSAIKALVDGTFKGGNIVFDIKNEGVGPAPFHDLDSKVPADVKEKVTKLVADLKSGAVKTGVPNPCQ